MVMSTAVALIACTACEETAPGDPDAEPQLDAGPDAGVADAGRDAGLDAGLDATPNARVVQHDFCDEPFFKLPIDGQDDWTSNIEIDGRRILWSTVQHYPQNVESELVLLDLVTCVERQIAIGSQPGRVHLQRDHVVWSEHRDDEGPSCSDLYHLDLSTGIQDRLTQSPGCELEPRTNGRYVAYRWVDKLEGPPTVSPTLRLLDMQTFEDIELWPSAVDSFDLDDRYVVWPGYGQDPQSVGRDVYVYDLQSGQTHHLDFTYDRYQWWVYSWQGWITIQGTDGGLYDPLNYLQLYNLDTQELRTLLEGDHAVSSASIRDGLVLYNSSAYSATPALHPSDLEIYEISTGLTRRLTQQQSDLRNEGISSPYVLLIHRLYDNWSNYMNDFYVANLESFGVLDATGNLVPGPPVINPPVAP